MKDLPLAVTIPAALGLAGVLWLLHKKSGSNTEAKKASKASSGGAREEEEHVPHGWIKFDSGEQTDGADGRSSAVSRKKVLEDEAGDLGRSDSKQKIVLDSQNGDFPQLSAMLDHFSMKCPTDDVQNGFRAASRSDPDFHDLASEEQQSEKLSQQKILNVVTSQNCDSQLLQLDESSYHQTQAASQVTVEGYPSGGISLTQTELTSGHAVHTHIQSSPSISIHHQNDRPLVYQIIYQRQHQPSVEVGEGLLGSRDGKTCDSAQLHPQPVSHSFEARMQSFNGARENFSGSSPSSSIEFQPSNLVQNNGYCSGYAKFSLSQRKSTMCETFVSVPEFKQSTPHFGNNAYKSFSGQNRHSSSPSASTQHWDYQNIQRSLSEEATGVYSANSSFDSVTQAHGRTNSTFIKNKAASVSLSQCPSSPFMPKASSSSIDSFGPDDIDALWGVQSSSEMYDSELPLFENDPAPTPPLPINASSMERVYYIDPSLSQEVHIMTAPVRESYTPARYQSDIPRFRKDRNSDSGLDPYLETNLKAETNHKPHSPFLDSNSVGSNDSGRGGSEHDIVCPGPETLAHFHFYVPSELCGLFIGRGGKNINFLRSKSGAHVVVNSNPYTPDYQLCQVSGTQTEVDDALGMIRRKFPLEKYPLFTMAPVSLSVPAQPRPPPVNQVVFPEVMQLSLPEGVSVDVFVSAVVDAGQVFVQQPTHRSFMSLEKMNYFMGHVYGQDPAVPGVPLPVESGIICVCESDGYWYRAMTMSSEDENGDVQVKFVDYGGYSVLPVTSLKQIRADFMSLPFQAVECFMANVTSNHDEKFFSQEATETLSEMTENKLLQCQVVARSDSGIPYIHLYEISSQTNSAVLINRALVNKRLVRWIEIL